MTWRDHLPIHPAASLFPLMTEPELRELGEDIKKNGMRIPIIVGHRDKYDHQFMLWDGRNRLDALVAVGLLKFWPQAKIEAPAAIWRDEFFIRTATGDWPLPVEVLREDEGHQAEASIISANIHRRHLKPEQRQELLIKLIARQPEWSNRQIAKETGYGHKTIGAARAKGEDVGKIPHVSRRLDSTGRKQPLRAKSKPKSVMLAEAVIGRSAKALAEFKFAADTYLPRMNADDLRAARQHFHDVCNRRMEAA